MFVFCIFAVELKNNVNMRTFQYYSYRLFLRCLLESNFELIHLQPTEVGFILFFDDRYTSELDKLFGSLRTLIDFEVLEFMDGTTIDHKSRFVYRVL